MQRWGGGEQVVGSAVLLRTGLLMSLATLGTAGLVVCGLLGVGGPIGDGVAITLGNGPSSTVDAGQREAVLSSPRVRPSVQSAAPRSRPVPQGRVAGDPPAPAQGDAAAVSGTVSAAALVPGDADLDSAGQPARQRVLAPVPAARHAPASSTAAPVPLARSTAAPQPSVRATGSPDSRPALQHTAAPAVPEPARATPPGADRRSPGAPPSLPAEATAEVQHAPGPPARTTRPTRPAAKVPAAQPAQAAATKAKPAQATPAQGKPAQGKPAPTKPAPSTPKAQPARAEPVKAEPAPEVAQARPAPEVATDRAQPVEQGAPHAVVTGGTPAGEGPPGKGKGKGEGPGTRS